MTTDKKRPPNANTQYNDYLSATPVIATHVQTETQQGNLPIGTVLGGVLGFLIPMGSSSVREGLISKIRGTPAEFDEGIRAFLKQTGLNDLEFGWDTNATPTERLRIKANIQRAVSENIIDVNTKQGQELVYFASYINNDGTVKSSFSDDFFNRELRTYTQALQDEFPNFPKELVVTTDLTKEQRAAYQKKLSAFMWEMRQNDDLYLSDLFERSSRLEFYCKQHLSWDGSTHHLHFDRVFNEADKGIHSSRLSGMHLADAMPHQTRQGLSHHLETHRYNRLGAVSEHITFEQEMHLRELQVYLEQHVEPRTGQLRNVTSLSDDLMHKATSWKKNVLTNRGTSDVGRKTLVQPTRKVGAVAKVAGGTVLGALAGGVIDYAMAAEQDYTPDMVADTSIQLESGMGSVLLDNMREYHALGEAGPQQMQLLAQVVLSNGYVTEDEVLGRALTYLRTHPDATFADYAKSDDAYPEAKKAYETIYVALRSVFERQDAQELFQEFGLDTSNTDMVDVVASNMLNGSFYHLLRSVVEQQQEYERANEAERKSRSDDDFFVMSPYGERYVEQEDADPSLVKDGRVKTV